MLNGDILLNGDIMVITISLLNCIIIEENVMWLGEAVQFLKYILSKKQ